MRAIASATCSKTTRWSRSPRTSPPADVRPARLGDDESIVHTRSSGRPASSRQTGNVGQAFQPDVFALHGEGRSDGRRVRLESLTYEGRRVRLKSLTYEERPCNQPRHPQGIASCWNCCTTAGLCPR